MKAPIRAVARPIIPGGVRSMITALRIGLMKPAAKPAMASGNAATSGTSMANTAKRGRPAIRECQGVDGEPRQALAGRRGDSGAGDRRR